MEIDNIHSDIFINYIFNYLNEFDIIMLSRVNKFFNDVYQHYNSKIIFFELYEYMFSNENDDKYFYKDNMLVKYCNGKPKKLYPIKYHIKFSHFKYILIYKDKLFYEENYGKIYYIDLTNDSKRTKLSPEEIIFKCIFDNYLITEEFNYLGDKLNIYNINDLQIIKKINIKRNYFHITKNIFYYQNYATKTIHIVKLNIEEENFEELNNFPINPICYYQIQVINEFYIAICESKNCAIYDIRDTEKININFIKNDMLYSPAQKIIYYQDLFFFKFPDYGITHVYHKDKLLYTITDNISLYTVEKNKYLYLSKQ